jgi:hypothetical protein
MEGKQLSLRLDCMGNDVIGTVLFHTFCLCAEELLLDYKGVADSDPHGSASFLEAGSGSASKWKAGSLRESFWSIGGSKSGKK